MEDEIEREPKQRNTGRVVLFVFLILLLAASAFSNFWLWNKEKAATSKSNSQIDSLQTYSTLRDSLYSALAIEEDKVSQLRMEIAMYQSGNDSLQTLLDEKEAKIRSLRAMVSGGGSTSKMRALKDSIASLSGENVEFRTKVETLLSENENYKAMLLEREGKITSLEGQKKTLSDKVEVAAQPNVGPVTVLPLYEKKGVFIPIYKAKKVERLQITFDVLGNKLTDKKIEKEYIVRIKNPDGIILSNDTKTLRDANDVFTAKESITFDGKQQKVKINFVQETFKKGKYQVELKEGDEVKQTFSFDLN